MSVSPPLIAADLDLIPLVFASLMSLENASSPSKNLSFQGAFFDSFIYSTIEQGINSDKLSAGILISSSVQPSGSPRCNLFNTPPITGISLVLQEIRSFFDIGIVSYFEYAKIFTFRRVRRECQVFALPATLDSAIESGEYRSLFVSYVLVNCIFHFSSQKLRSLDPSL